MNAKADKQKLQELMMAALDGECSSADRRLLDEALTADAALRQEWLELQRVKEVTNMMSIRKPPDEVWQDYWASVYPRLERGIAWIFISLGVVVLLAWGIWEAIREITADTAIPGFIKLAMAALFIGLLVLFISVVREKLFVRKHDPYKDIER